MKLAVIDNNDSFTANLEHLLAVTTGTRPIVFPCSELTQIDPTAWDIVVISAGPGKPSEYPDYCSLLESQTPVLGICLGMQIINEHFGGTTARLPDCVHGKTDIISFNNRDFKVARYHSLWVDSVADCLEVFATNSRGVPMALHHVERKIIAYQFHPESFLTPNGRFFIEYATSFLNQN